MPPKILHFGCAAIRMHISNVVPWLLDTIAFVRKLNDSLGIPYQYINPSTYSTCIWFEWLHVCVWCLSPSPSPFSHSLSPSLLCVALLVPHLFPICFSLWYNGIIRTFFSSHFAMYIHNVFIANLYMIEMGLWIKCESISDKIFSKLFDNFISQLWDRLRISIKVIPISIDIRQMSTAACKWKVRVYWLTLLNCAICWASSRSTIIFYNLYAKYQLHNILAICCIIYLYFVCYWQVTYSRMTCDI